MKRIFKNKTMLPVLMLSLAIIVNPSDDGSGGGGDIPFSPARYSTSEPTSPISPASPDFDAFPFSSDPFGDDSFFDVEAAGALRSPGCFGDFDLNTGLGSPYSPAAASVANVVDRSTAEAASAAGAQASTQSVGESHVAVVVADTADRPKNKKAAKSKKTSASSANAPATDDNDLEEDLFRAIRQRKRMEIRNVLLKKLGTLNFVSTQKEYSPLKLAAVRGDMGILRILLESGCPLHRTDETELLDFVNGTIQELQSQNRTKNEQAKLSRLLNVMKLLVNDTGGPSSTSRFKYVNTPIVYRIDRTVGCTADLVSASSASAGSGGGSETVAVDAKIRTEAEHVILEESKAGGLTPALLANKILRRVLLRDNLSAETGYYLFEQYAQECDPFMESMQEKTLLESSIFKANRYFDSTRLLLQKIVSMGGDHKKRALELLDSLKATKLTSYNKKDSFRCLAKIYQAIHDLDPTRYPNFCFIMNGYFKRDSIMKDAVLRAISNDLGTLSGAKASFSAESSFLSAAASAGSGGGGGGGGGGGSGGRGSGAAAAAGATAAKPKAAKRKLSGERPAAVDAKGNSNANLNKKR